MHWGTFQLDDEEPDDAATDLATAVARHQAPGFGLLEIGGMARIAPPGDGPSADAASVDAPSGGAAPGCAVPPLQLRSTTAARSLGACRPDRPDSETRPDQPDQPDRGRSANSM